MVFKKICENDPNFTAKNKNKVLKFYLDPLSVAPSGRSNRTGVRSNRSPSRTGSEYSDRSKSASRSYSMSQVRTFPMMGISKLGLRSRTITGNKPEIIQKRVSFIFTETDSETGSEPEVDVFSISPRLLSPDFIINSTSSSTFVAHDNSMMHENHFTVIFLNFDAGGNTLLPFSPHAGGWSL